MTEEVHVGCCVRGMSVAFGVLCQVREQLMSVVFGVLCQSLSENC